MADQYARVEIMGHRVRIGRVSEITQFGAAMCQVEPINEAGELGPPETYGGAALFCVAYLPSRDAAIEAVRPYWSRIQQLPAHGESSDPDFESDPDNNEDADVELF